MRLNAHLTFPGTCEEAFRFYEQCFGGKFSFRIRYSESSMDIGAPPEFKDKVLHASVSIGGNELSGADSWHAEAKQPANGYTLSLSYSDPVELERVFAALAAGGKVTLPVQKTFWTTHFGMLTDRYGVPWMLNLNQAEGQAEA